MSWYQCGYGQDDFTGIVKADTEDEATDKYHSYLITKGVMRLDDEDVNKELFWSTKIDGENPAIVVLT